MWSSLLIISFVKSVKFSSQLAVDDIAIKDTCCNASKQSRERKVKIIVRAHKASLFTCTTLEKAKFTIRSNRRSTRVCWLLVLTLERLVLLRRIIILFNLLLVW